MNRHIFRIAASILVCFLIQIQGADQYTDENRPYEFGFEVEVEGMKQQHRHEEKDKDGIIKGEFGFITADDVYHVTVYATDKDGHFKILSMKNIHLKSSTASAGSLSSSPRQGHALSLPASTKLPPAPATAARATIPGAPLAPKIAPRVQTQAISTFTSNAPPHNNVAPQTSFTPVPEPSPVRACSGCSVPTSPKPPPNAPQVNNFNQNQQTILAVPAPPSSNNIQRNDFGQSVSYKFEQPNSPNLSPAIITNGRISPQQPIEASYSPGLSKEQVNHQTPSQSVYPVQGLSNNQQGIQSNQKFNPQQGISVQNYLNQPSQSLYPPRELPNNAEPMSQQPIQSSYPQQTPSVPNNARPTFQQPSQSLNPPQEPSISNNAGPISQQPIQSSYPQQVPSVPNNARPTSQQPSQSSYPLQVPSVPNNDGLTSQPPDQSSYPQQVPSVPNNAAPTSKQPSQSSHPLQVPSVPNNDGLISQQPGQLPEQGHLVQSNPLQVSQLSNSTPRGLAPAVSQSSSNQQGGSGEREPKQYNGLQQSQGLGQPGTTKPKLVSVDMQIVDKNTDIRALQPGEKEGLPAGLSEHDMSRLLYTFNYTVGFHGHFEEGYENGVKKGYYYVIGRNGVRTRIDYVADGTGFHPKVSQEVLDLLSDDVPKPETEKDAKYGLKSYEFKWLYYPVGS